jgi:hypothetical protein
MDKTQVRDSLIDLGAGYRTRVQEDGTGAVLVLVHGLAARPPRSRATRPSS